MFSLHLRDVEISVTLTCLCMFSQTPDFSATLSLSFFFIAKPAVFWIEILETATAACLAAPGSPTALPIHALCCRMTPHPFKAIPQVSKPARKPFQVHDTHRGWVFSTRQEQAAFDGKVQACSTGVSPWVSFLEGSSVTIWGAFWSMCLVPSVLLQSVTAAALTGCRTGKDHLPVPSERWYLLILRGGRGRLVW